MAGNGRLLSRAELVIADEVLKSRQTSAQLSQAVQRARFWKFTYGSNGLRIGGYLAEKLYQQRHPFRLVMFEGADHNLSEHREERDRITLDWFNTYVRDRERWPSLEPHGR